MVGVTTDDRAGGKEAGMEEVTIKDIARLCGVGVSTVSRAINNHPDINPETRDHILNIIKEYNYIPNNSARNLKRTESKTIAILVKAIDNPFFSSMIRVFEKEIKYERFDFFLQHIDNNQDEIEVAIGLAKEKKLMGIVFLGGFSEHSDEALRQLKVPFVVSTVELDNSVEDGLYSFVSVDDKKESRRLADYLIGLGHRRIALLSAQKDDESIGKLRMEGYKSALAQHGIPLDEDLIVYTPKDCEVYSRKSGYVMTQQLMEREKDFTAVIAISDMVAVGACKAAFQKGKKIPEDYSVAGFDGLPETFYYEPSITTIRQPLEEIAESSIKNLFYMIRHEEKAPNKKFEGELLKRESTRKIG